MPVNPLHDELYHALDEVLCEPRFNGQHISVADVVGVLELVKFSVLAGTQAPPAQHSYPDVDPEGVVVTFPGHNAAPAADVRRSDGAGAPTETSRQAATDAADTE